MSHSNSTSTQHTHPLEKTPEPHLKRCVLVVSLDSLQHFCLLLSLTLAARHSFLQQTTSLPSAPYSQHVPLEFLFKALGLRCFWFFFSLSTPPVFPCCKDYLLLCVFLQKKVGLTAAPGASAHGWATNPGARGVKAMSCCKCTAEVYPCHFFSLLLMCRNSARRAQFFSGLCYSELFRSCKVNFVCKPHEPLACFPGRCREDTGHLFASSFLCKSMVTSALLDIACAVCRMLKRGFYDCCLSGNSKKIRYLSHEVHLVGKNIK